MYTRGPHVQSMVAKRGLANRGKHSYPYVKKLFKTQYGRIPIDPAILADVCGDQKLFLGALLLFSKKVNDYRYMKLDDGIKKPTDMNL